MRFVQKEKISSHPPLKKLKSLNDLDQAHDDQEIAFLKLQVLEQQSMIDELTRVSVFISVYWVWNFTFLPFNSFQYYVNNAESYDLFKLLSHA